MREVLHIRYTLLAPYLSSSHCLFRSFLSLCAYASGSAAPVRNEQRTSSAVLALSATGISGYDEFESYVLAHYKMDSS
jgi:hypothetical protein